MAQRTFTILGVQVELCRLIPDLQILLLLGFLESLSTEQVIIIAMVVLLGVRAAGPKDPSSCR